MMVLEQESEPDLPALDLFIPCGKTYALGRRMRRCRRDRLREEEKQESGRVLEQGFYSSDER
jgi:hypothetical protein